MKETVRVNLHGELTEFRKSWESRADWPFGYFGVATFPSSGPDVKLVRELLPQYPEVTATQFVERSYSKKELLGFDLFVMWVNGHVDTTEGQGLLHGPDCPECGFPTFRRRSLPSADFFELNSHLERSFNHFTLISGKAYRLLSDLKATGWWVQPVHLI